MNDQNYDFGGWATRNDLLCSDGRTIKRDAFKDCDGITVPLVWQHHGLDGPENILGQALLHNMPEGVYCYGKFNDTPNGKLAKSLVGHGDIGSLSIFANKLKQIGKDVVHGSIKEVSLVLSGANPGAYIETVMCHSDSEEEEAVLYNDQEGLSFNDLPLNNDNEIEHGDQKENPDMDKEKNDNKTIGDIFDTLTEEQKNAVYAIVGTLLENAEEDENNNKEETNMKHNCFDNDTEPMENDALTHDDISDIFKNARRLGSLKEAVLEHGDDIEITYGIENIDYLFPDARNVTNTPTFIKRDTGWVSTVMNGVHHSPFSKIKSTFANITEDAARAKGYIKGKFKKEEVFSLLKRSTSPTTVYKKQKLDRDDILDITDFDATAWVKSEMRGMLDEELARAILIGDGRLTSDDDHISTDHIRPVWTDADLFTIKKTFANDNDTDVKAANFIEACIRARKDYKGSGNPTLFTTEDMLTDCLLMKDGVGRDLYESADKLATKLRVDKIITVPVMENCTRTVDNNGSSETHTLQGLILNMKDYTVGADKGGSVNMFEDFDIDFNAEKYLIETRCSGALTVPFSAIAIESI